MDGTLVDAVSLPIHCGSNACSLLAFCSADPSESWANSRCLSILNKLQEMQLGNPLTQRLSESMDFARHGGLGLRQELDTARLEWASLIAEPVHFYHDLRPLQHLLASGPLGRLDPEAVLAAMADGGTMRSRGSYEILDEVMVQRRPCIAVDLNAQDGYAAVRMALHMRSWAGGGCQVYALQDDPLHAAILQNICEIAGVGDIVHCLCGPLPDSLSVLSACLHGRLADLLLLHNATGSRLLENFSWAADLGILGCGSALMIEGILQPGTPELLWGLIRHGRDALSLVELVEVHAELGLDWMLVCQLREARNSVLLRGSTSDFPELASLIAESDYVSSQMLASAVSAPRADGVQERLLKRAEQLSQRAVAAFTQVGISPTRRVGTGLPSAGYVRNLS